MITDHRPGLSAPNLLQPRCCPALYSHMEPPSLLEMFSSSSYYPNNPIPTHHPPPVPKSSCSPGLPQNSSSHLTVTRILRTSVLDCPLGRVEPH